MNGRSVGRNIEGIIPNKSKTYLLPLISEFIPLPIDIVNKSLVNTYLADSEKKHKDCIYLLFDYDIKNPEFTSYEYQLFKNDKFVESYDVGKRVLYVFNFPKEYLEEYKYFKEGKYSQFGIDAKILIIRFLSKLIGTKNMAMPFLKRVKQILHKDNELRMTMEKELDVTIPEYQELGQKYDEEKETFKFLKTDNEF